jgi:hypothetical protein
MSNIDLIAVPVEFVSMTVIIDLFIHMAKFVVNEKKNLLFSRPSTKVKKL